MSPGAGTKYDATASVKQSADAAPGSTNAFKKRAQRLSVTPQVRQARQGEGAGIELGLSDHFPGLDPVELDSGCG